MSGPKAFTVVAAPAAVPLAPVVAVIAAGALAASLAKQATDELRRENERRAELKRAEEARKAERERLRKIAEAKAAAEAAERKRILDAEIAGILSACQVELESSTALLDSRFSFEDIEAEFSALQESAVAAKESASIRTAADRLKSNLQEQIENIRTFRAFEAECRDSMATATAENAVRTFSAAELSKLKDSYEALSVGGTLRSNGPEKAAEKLQEVIAASRAIVKESLTKESQFDVRNKLLQTTIDALKSLGFFVSDPEYANPSNPLGNVVLSGTRGSERVILSVPLVGDVQSDWQGVPDEPCKGDFFAFLDKLEEGGFPCKPTRPDLQERPKLLRKGEKQLPGGAGGTRTA